MARSQSDLKDAQAQPQKPYGQILIEEIEQGQHELERPAMGLFLSAISAGLDIGFSLFLIGVMKTAIGSSLPEPVSRILIANMYAIGFIFVILGRSELFTEHTTLAILPLIGGKSNVQSVARLWAIVYVGNLIGAAAFAGLTNAAGPAIHVISTDVLREIAADACHAPAGAMLLSAILAGWLMGLMSWLTTAARDTISQVVVVWMVAGTIGFARLHHSIVGSVEVLAGLFAGGVTLRDLWHFLLWTTLGNAIGGGVFVALLKHSHASRSK